MKKILIIEDNDALRQEIVEWFGFEGYNAIGASNGTEGIEVAMATKPDLILCDIMMPEKDGREVLATLRQQKETALIPFIFITALTDRSNVRSGMESGADDYVTKPFTREELMKTVNTRLNRSERVEEKTELAMDELRRNMIRMMPQELLTPLNNIYGYGQLMEAGTKSYTREEIMKIGKTIVKAAERLSHLMQNYFTYARLEMNQLPPSPEQVISNPDWVLSHQAQQVARRFDRLADLTMNLEPGTVFITEIEFFKILEELIDNAFKFSAPGSAVAIKSSMVDGSFSFVVEDHGRGMNTDQLSRVGAFMQFDRQLQEQQGTGLGLIIAKKLIELYQGSLKIESEPGKGTRITVQLPGNKKNEV